MEILQWLHKMLGGSSPITGYIGSGGTIFALFDLLSGHVQTALVETGGVAPSNRLEWIILALAVAIRFAKDANRTNSQHPTAEAVPVPKVSASPFTVPSKAFDLPTPQPPVTGAP